MHDKDETQYEKRARAGLIPYIKTPDGYQYLMMISSDPKFGGPKPMISKGKIEPGETPAQAALREAEEELGLKAFNIKDESFDFLVGERVILYSGTYDLSLYSCEILDRHDFDKWCDETEYTEWFSLMDFQQRGRRDHIKYVERLENKLRSYKLASTNME
jgi:8-oxo-dGTP pyrophosphatase MutT (NUDIX family)